MWRIDKGETGSDLYRFLVAELDIRKLRKQPLILKRPERARDTIGSNVASGLAELESYGQTILANPDVVTRLKVDADEDGVDALAVLVLDGALRSRGRL